MRRLTWGLAACLAVWAGFGEAQAAPITYTFTVTASGSLGPNPFNNAALTVTDTANTDSVREVSPGLFQVLDLTATVSVAGLGTATFTFATITFLNQNVSGVVGTFGPGTDILDVIGNPALDTYDLTTSIGPLTGSPLFSSGIHFRTTSGDLVLDGVSGNATFAAVASPAPEPSGLALTAVGLAGVVGFVWRRKPAAA
jgi:hypothetical protein